MALDPSWVGRKGGRSRIVIERGPVANFARAVKDANPVYQDPRAAEAAGLDAIPAPPTFLMAAPTWGSYPELQPADNGGPNPLGEVGAEYHRQGGLLLHGEQRYTYERPIQVGDVLDSETEIVDTYTKGSMTFAVVDVRYTDAETGELVATATYNMINKQ
jgi:acyl dehydratase